VLELLEELAEPTGAACRAAAEQLPEDVAEPSARPFALAAREHPEHDGEEGHHHLARVPRAAGNGGTIRLALPPAS